MLTCDAFKASRREGEQFTAERWQLSVSAPLGTSASLPLSLALSRSCLFLSMALSFFLSCLASRLYDPFSKQLLSSGFCIQPKAAVWFCCRSLPSYSWLTGPLQPHGLCPWPAPRSSLTILTPLVVRQGVGSKMLSDFREMHQSCRCVYTLRAALNAFNGLE